MKEIIVTGKPGCPQCVILEKSVSKLTDKHVKIDITTDPAVLELVKEGGNRMPACILIMDDGLVTDRFIVGAQNAPRVPVVKAFLEKNECL